MSTPRPIDDPIADASRALIATAIATGRIPDGAVGIRPDDLPMAAHGIAWGLCLDLTPNISPHGLATLAAQRQVTQRLPDGGAAGWAEALAGHSEIPNRVGQLVEILMAHAGRRALERNLTEVIVRARCGAPFADLVDDAYRAVAQAREHSTAPSATQCLDGVAHAAVTWLWRGRLAVGKITVLDGLPGTGKSTVTCDWAARVSRGQAFPGDTFAHPAAGALFIAAEDGIADTVVPRLQACGADLRYCHVWRADNLPRLPDDIDQIERAVIKSRVRLLVIDPIAALFARDLSQNIDADVRRALTPLAVLAEKHAITIVLLRHLNKRTGGSALDRGGGSIGISALARVVLLLGRDQEDPETLILAPVKNNLTRTPLSLKARIVDAAGVGKIEWLGDCATTADSLVTDHPTQSTTKRDEAGEILQSILSDGEWHRQREVEHQARSASISLPTLKRAKKDLGVESSKHGENWFWRLPKEINKGMIDSRDPLDPVPRREPLHSNNIKYLEIEQDHGDHPIHSHHRDPLLSAEDAV